MIDFKTASLEDFLNHKTMYYDKIDFSFVKESWDIISKVIKIPYVIHIVGTNGKGSTGRFLAHYLNKKSFKVLHYSSPHILEFNERIWIDGRNSTSAELNFAHKKLQEILPLDLLKILTYFEYTTLLSIILCDGLDYLVFEAGLGGEFDATNIVPNDLSLITTIDLDHQSFLGNTIKEITKTKMRSVDNHMIVGYQVHNEVCSIAEIVKKELKKEFNKDISIQIIKEYDEYYLNNKFAKYLKRNLYLAISCLKHLDIKIDLELFDDVELLGRCQKIKPNITVDVGHNPLAASVLVDEFKNKKINLIYNSYADKDYTKVLEILKPIIRKIIILDIEDKRVVNKNNLLEICESLNIIVCEFEKIDKNEEYLVFGSFLVVEKFIKDMGFNEK